MREKAANPSPVDCLPLVLPGFPSRRNLSSLWFAFLSSSRPASSSFLLFTTCESCLWWRFGGESGLVKKKGASFLSSPSLYVSFRLFRVWFRQLLPFPPLLSFCVCVWPGWFSLKGEDKMERRKWLTLSLSSFAFSFCCLHPLRRRETFIRSQGTDWERGRWKWTSHHHPHRFHRVKSRREMGFS